MSLLYLTLAQSAQSIMDVRDSEKRTELILKLFSPFHPGDRVIIFFPFCILKISFHKNFQQLIHILLLSSLTLRKYVSYFSENSL